MTTYTGNCFCGAVEFDVTGEQIAAGYCHCRDCAHWGASPVSAYAIFPAGSVAVTKGADNIATYNKTPHLNRKHCHPGCSPAKRGLLGQREPDRSACLLRRR